VTDTQIVFAGNRELVTQEQVIIAVNAAGERVLDGDQAIFTRTSLHRGKDGIKRIMRHRFNEKDILPEAEKLQDSRFGISTLFTLKGYTHIFS
jgi:hypothetical protein